MKEEIKKFFKGDVEDSEETLAKYSRDASIFEVRPQLVLFPRDKEDVKNLVKWANDAKDLYDHPGNPGANISITARCAGTDMSGGAIGESIVLDFTRYMNRLVGGPLPLDGTKKKKDFSGHYPRVPSYITVEPGMFYRDFEKITLAKGLILPCFTASKSINAIGGMFGNNSAGERTLQRGQTEQYVLSSKVIFADGNEYVVRPLSKPELEKKMAQGDFEGNLYKKIYELIRDNEAEIQHAKPAVSKNSSGYYLWNVLEPEKKNFDDGRFRPKGGGMSRNFSSPAYFDLNKLLVGSQGTLGIMTEVTLKIIPEDEYSRLAVLFVDDLGPLGRLVDDILTLHPETLETYDDKTMKLAVKFFPDFLKNKGLLGMFKFMWSFLPEFFMVLRGGIPKLMILVEFTGDNEKALEGKLKELEEKISNYKLKVHVTRGREEAEKYWDIRRESFALLRKHVRGRHTAPFIDDVIVRPEFLPKFIPELNQLLSGYKDRLMYTLAGHAGNGNFHIIPLMDFKRRDTAETVLEVSEKVFELVRKYHGSIAAEHNDGLIRTPFVAAMFGENMVSIFKKVKEIFDPKYIFNPGKKVPAGERGGTKKYIAEHVAVEHEVLHKA